MMQARMWQAWQDVTANGAGPEVAIVSHGGSIKLLLVKLFGDTPEMHNVRLENTSVTTVTRDGQGWKLSEAAAIAHLEGLEDTLFSAPVHSPPEHQNI